MYKVIYLYINLSIMQTSQLATHLQKWINILWALEIDWINHQSWRLARCPIISLWGSLIPHIALAIWGVSNQDCQQAVLKSGILLLHLLITFEVTQCWGNKWSCLNVKLLEWYAISKVPYIPLIPLQLINTFGGGDAEN